MQILAVDTTYESLSAALLEDGNIRAEVFINTGADHSLNLLPAIKYVCDVAGVAVEAMDFFACTLGPGSFTGSRIGAATVKGLAIGTGKKVVGISTLEALAANIGQCAGKVRPIVDAKRGEVYTALYTIEADCTPELIGPEGLMDFDSLLAILEEDAVFVGSGAVKYADLIRRTLPGASVAPRHCSYIRAGIVGILGIKKYRRGETLDAITFTPRYLRMSEAESKLETFSCKGKDKSRSNFP